MNPRSSCATGRSFLSLDRVDGHRIETIAPIGRSRGLFVDGHAFGEPARDAMIGRGQHVDVAQFVPQACSPSETLPGGRPEGLSIATTVPNVTPSAPSPGMPIVRTAKSS